jgi:hypothetical protein
MQEDKYKDFLKTAPQDHFSDEFLEFLRKYNEVDWEGEYWLVIKNIKYGDAWLTAFYKRWRTDIDSNTQAGIAQMFDLLDRYRDREWMIKAPHKRSVKLFHVHLIKKQ